MSEAERACPTTKKLRFATRAEAKAKIRRLGMRKVLQPYQCKCGAWHMRHKTQTRRRRELLGNQPLPPHQP